MSSRESIASERYGWVWKKSKETTAASAVTTRPPGRRGGDGHDDDHQHECGVGGVEERADRAITAATPTAAGTPTTTPIVRPGSSMVGSAWFASITDHGTTAVRRQPRP